jgi:hypothetical protein
MVFPTTVSFAEVILYRQKGKNRKQVEATTQYFIYSGDKAYTVKKRLVIFPSLAGMSLTKLSLACR